MLEDQLAKDLKTSMLAGDSARTETLKMLKSALLYKAVELGVRDSGLSEEQVIDVLSKESKKRAEVATMYEKAGRVEQAAAEKFEQEIISQYLPKQASDEEIITAIDLAIAKMGDVSMQQMGQVIGAVKAQLGQTADGSRVATLVKEKLS
ncbi:MAG TPA: GatB/YqeY domain-containing protein [Candidatus Saccharibacteria bacterium]|nr:GatB/YqeY domain-containing protein [Candidatus Saccharibacteria bacterium]